MENRDLPEVNFVHLVQVLQSDRWSSPINSVLDPSTVVAAQQTLNTVRSTPHNSI
jgi:hypothetical protein